MNEHRNMEQHRGKIFEAVVRKCGYPLKTLAAKLGISRNTIYNKFKEYDLSYDFILEVGELIHYDFSYEYPEMKATVSINKNQQVAELWWLERKYTRLLERYHNLLSFLLRMANEYHVESLKKDMDKFLELS